MKVMWVWSSEALHQDPDSEIPCEPLPRLFQVRRRLSFIFSAMKLCFSVPCQWESLIEAH